MSEPKVENGTLTYPVWWQPNPNRGIMFNRDCLDHDHPEQTYNYLKRFGITPEHYGIEHPRVREMMQLYAHKSRAELIYELMNMRDQIMAYERAGF